MPVDEFGRVIPSLFTGPNVPGIHHHPPSDVSGALRRRSPSPPMNDGHPSHHNRFHYDRPPPPPPGGPRYGYNRNRFPPGGPYSNNNQGDYRGNHHMNQHFLHPPLTSHPPHQGLPPSRFNNSNSSINASLEVPPQPNIPEQKKHPSFEYVAEPLACEYVWKHSGQAEAAKKTIDLKRETSGSRFKTEDTALDDGGTKANDPNVKDSEDAILSKLYEEYRKRYCLNYIRAFFNKHLDDSWFRQRFSPAVRKMCVIDLEKARASTEAQIFHKQVLESASDFLNGIRLGNGVKQGQQLPTTPMLNSPLPSPRKQHQPLDGGDSQQGVVSNTPPLHHLFSFQQAQAPSQQRSLSPDPRAPQPPLEMFSALHIVDIPSHATDEHVAIALRDQYNATVLARHEQQLAQQQQSVEKSLSNGDDGGPGNNNSNPVVPKKGTKPITPIPAPTLLRLNEITIYPAPATLVSDGPPSIIMHRQVLAVGPPAAFTEIMVSLKQQQDTRLLAAAVHDAGTNGGSSGPHSGPPGKRLVPRKGVAGDSQTSAEPFYRLFDLEVECTDQYGRMDYDVDGRGGATTDNPAIPQRKAIVGVCPVHTFFSLPSTSRTFTKNNNINLATANLRKHQHHANVSSFHQQSHPFSTTTVVLSAAVSSKKRIEQDHISARRIAQGLDLKKKIPEGYRLEDIVQEHFTGNEIATEDLLDVSIAYLRRVHLLSFYNGCYEAETIGDVMAGKHPASTIHLRLQNADDYIQRDIEKVIVTPRLETNVEASGENGTETEKIDGQPPILSPQLDDLKKDMLVQRLDDSISRALESSKKWLDAGDDAPEMLDEMIEKDAEEIARAEEDVKDKWIDDHCIIDADGRARCSFRFCHKLFKGSSFLEKHLLKKHAEFLRAERAKCHDTYMMSAWDACVCRPVPPILVDCGSHFGCVSASIIAAAEPDVVDPEPALWQREEEKRIREKEMEQRREELRQQNSNNNSYHKSDHHHRNGGGEFGSLQGGDGSNLIPPPPPPPPPPPRQSRGSGGFVDVDDMKEEKVELTFDDVEVDNAADILASANKKKKKKRKLL